MPIDGSSICWQIPERAWSVSRLISQIRRALELVLHSVSSSTGFARSEVELEIFPRFDLSGATLSSRKLSTVSRVNILFGNYGGLVNKPVIVEACLSTFKLASSLANKLLHF